jgi:hypothetical protein
LHWLHAGQVTVCPQTCVEPPHRLWQSGILTVSWIEAHAPASHHSPLGQGVVQLWFRLASATHSPPSQTWQAWHWLLAVHGAHAPPSQIGVGLAQAVWQSPQWSMSVCRSKQPAAQQTSSPVHAAFPLPAQTQS